MLLTVLLKTPETEIGRRNRVYSRPVLRGMEETFCLNSLLWRVQGVQRASTVQKRLQWDHEQEIPTLGGNFPEYCFLLFPPAF
jgi:hypothetical protein